MYTNNYEATISPRAHAYIAIQEAKRQGLDLRFFRSPEAFALDVKLNAECEWSEVHEVAFLMSILDLTSKMWFKGLDHLRRESPKAFYTLYEQAYDDPTNINLVDLRQLYLVPYPGRW